MADNSDTNSGTIAQGLFAIAKAIDGLADRTHDVAIQLKWLGNGDAAGPFGAIEGFAVEMKKALQDLGADHITAAERIAANLSSDASL